MGHPDLESDEDGLLLVSRARTGCYADFASDLGDLHLPLARCRRLRPVLRRAEVGVSEAT